MKRKFGFFAFAALLAGAVLAFGLSACSNGSDSSPVFIVVPDSGTQSGGSGASDGANTNSGGTNSGGTTQTTDGTQTGGGTTQTDSGTQTGGGETPGGTTPTTTTYTITFNANDGSQSPATATQTFTEGTPQALKTVKELGFSKDNFYFAGWETSADATKASYADGASYTATAAATLYAVWSDSPVFNVNVLANENGSVTASHITAAAGTEITLSNTPNAGYQFGSYAVTDADGTAVPVTDGKFTMPAKSVTVTAAFNAINYKINVVTAANGSVEASAQSATIGTSVTLTASPASGYELESFTVTDSNGAFVSLSGTGNSRSFTMPAQNVTVTAVFSAISYNINMGTVEHGSVTASAATATAGTSVTLTAKPAIGYELATVTVTTSDGTSVPMSGTGNERTFTMPAKYVTITVVFAEIPAASGVYTKTGTTTINGAQYDFVTFGLWPQTIKAAAVEIDEKFTKKAGSFTYCRGSDGQWYVNIKENACSKNFFKYSDGTIAAESSANSYKWFKVEPIKWRVLTADYNGTGRKLLFAENVLEWCYYYDDCGNRTIDGNTVYPNSYEHSKIRAFLNGLSYQKGSYMQAACDDFLGKGFLQTAFSDAELAKIADTSVDNSARSTLPDNYDSLVGLNEKKQYWNNGTNRYASDTPTTDKVFLLSVQEITKTEYGFDFNYNDDFWCDNNDMSSNKIRKMTDYAKASGADGAAYSIGDGCGGECWLRSPYFTECAVRGLRNKLWYTAVNVNAGRGGFVPALCVED